MFHKLIFKTHTQNIISQYYNYNRFVNIIENMSFSGEESTPTTMSLSNDEFVNLIKENKINKQNLKSFTPEMLRLIEIFRMRITTFLTRTPKHIDVMKWLQSEDDGSIPMELSNIQKSFIQIVMPKTINHITKENKNDIVLELSGSIYYVVGDGNCVHIFNAKRIKVENKTLDEAIGKYFINKVGLFQVMYDKVRKLLKIVDVGVYGDKHLNFEYTKRILPICNDADLCDLLYSDPIPNPDFKLIKTNTDLMFAVDQCIHIKNVEQVIVVGRSVNAFENLSKHVNNEEFLDMFIRNCKEIPSIYDYIKVKYPDFYGQLEMDIDNIKLDDIANIIKPLINKMFNVEEFRRFLKSKMTTNSEWFTEHWVLVSPLKNKLVIVGNVPLSNTTLSFSARIANETLQQEYEEAIVPINKKNIIDVVYLDTGAVVVLENKAIKDTLKIVPIDSVRDIFNIESNNWVEIQTKTKHDLKRVGLSDIIEYIRNTSAPCLDEPIQQLENYYKSTKYWHGQPANKKRKIN